MFFRYLINFFNGRIQKKIITNKSFSQPAYPNISDEISIILYAGYTAESSLTEWLDFHFQSGVNHVYVYDSSYATRKISIDEKFLPNVTIIPHDYIWRPIKSINAHSLAYAHAVRNFGSLYKWMIFLDSDEFIYTKSCRSLKDVLQDYSDKPALAIPWLMFGFGGNNTRPNISTFHAYTERLIFPVQSKIKCIVQPKFVTAIINDHIVEVNNGLSDVVDQFNNKIKSTTYSYVDLGDIRINHYYTKSREELINKIKNRSIMDEYDVEVIMKKVENFEKTEKIIDSTIIDYIDKSNIVINY